MPRLLCALLAVALGCCTGCAHYRPEPLEPLQVSRILREASLADAADELRQRGQPPPDLAAGIGPDEAGLIALVLNPALKARRLERGVAAGQLVTAGLYPNPTLDNRSLLFSQKPVGRRSVEANFAIEVLRWQEHYANIQAKEANLRAVEYDIVNDEWKTASDARAAWWSAVGARERLRLNQEQLELSARLLDFAKSRIRHGAGTALDGNLAELQDLRLRLDRQKLESDADTAARTLRLALGLPFDAEAKLRIPEKPLTPTAPAWKLDDLIASLPTSAPMKAYEWRYAIAEGELRAAIAKQYPSLRIGPGGTFDFDGNVWSSLLGAVVAADLPFINRNQGEIKEKFAARSAAYAEYRAQLQKLQASVAEAAAQVERIGQRVAFQEKELTPKGQESIQLTEKAYKAGDVAGSELLLARSLFIDTEKSHLELLIDYRQALENLEAVLGRRLEDIPVGEVRP